MFQRLFEDHALLDLPVVTLIGFFAVFVGVLAWVYVRRRASHFDGVAHLPLDDDPGGHDGVQRDIGGRGIEARDIEGRNS
ncbi:MAG: cbb3-type cytochrome c oxidase subunit 3 [Planctomycetes bacterium]|nr:cbb3-type cytochrome c oxidase subunit 3 [Planctomycetota bacterium]